MNKSIDKSNLADYRTFLSKFIERGYRTIFFDELNESDGQLILRHDIDFDIQAALKMAKIEHEMGLKSSYFFLVGNASYNPFDKENAKAILEIKSLGHTISLHFDPTIYADFKIGFDLEKNCFESFFKTQIDIISLHRPNAYFQELNTAINQCDHTYMKKYFKDILYVADSGGTFRFGHPYETDTFKNKQNIHLLIHPIWWLYEGNNAAEKLKSFYSKKKELLKIHYAFHCKPFNSICHELD